MPEALPMNHNSYPERTTCVCHTNLRSQRRTDAQNTHANECKNHAEVPIVSEIQTLRK